MAIYLQDGDVLIDTGSIAMHADCCCDDCTVNSCQCVDGDNGSIETFDRVDIVITGSSSCVESIPFCAGNQPGYDWTGTWSADCGSSSQWQRYQYLCEATGEDYYSWERMGIDFLAPFPSGALIHVKLEIQSGIYYIAAGGTAPTDDADPPLAGTSAIGNTHTWTWESSLTYLCSGSGYRGCRSSMPSPITSNGYTPGSTLYDCDYSGYSPTPTLYLV